MKERAEGESGTHRGDSNTAESASRAASPGSGRQSPGLRSAGVRGPRQRRLRARASGWTVVRALAEYKRWECRRKQSSAGSDVHTNEEHERGEVEEGATSVEHGGAGSGGMEQADQGAEGERPERHATAAQVQALSHMSQGERSGAQEQERQTRMRASGAEHGTIGRSTDAAGNSSTGRSMPHEDECEESRRGDSTQPWKVAGARKMKRSSNTSTRTARKNAEAAESWTARAQKTENTAAQRHGTA